MLSANITSDLGAAIGRLEKLSERLPMAAGNIVAKQIRTFSQEYQMTPDGASFKELTPAYKRRKMRSGRPGVPNLTWSGELMRETKARKAGGNVEVGPQESQQAQAEGLSKKRPFVGLAPETPGIIEASFQKIFAEL